MPKSCCTGAIKEDDVIASARKLKSGSYRCLVYDYTDGTGKKHYKSFTALTKKEAEYLAAQYAVEKKEKPVLPDYTLKTAIDNYCNLKNNVLSPATIREYRRMGNQNYKDRVEYAYGGAS